MIALYLVGCISIVVLFILRRASDRKHNKEFISQSWNRDHIYRWGKGEY